MTPDQKIQVWNAVGTWLSGIATFAAVLVALHLAKRAERIRLKCHVGLREQIEGDGSPPVECLCFDITNLGERPVTINSIGWVIGKGKAKRYAIQQTPAPHHRELAYGKQTMYIIPFNQAPNWLADFGSNMIKTTDWNYIKTLRVQVHTSLGVSIKVVPELSFLKALSKQSVGA